MKVNLKIITSILLIFFCRIYTYASFADSDSLGDISSYRFELDPMIVGVGESGLEVKVAFELDSIRVYDLNHPELNIESFKLVIFRNENPIDTFMFKGKVAPNIFKGYKLYTSDPEGNEYSDFTQILLYVIYSDSNKKIIKSMPSTIYFCVKRFAGKNGWIIKK